jgi:3-hydroxy acid dehydrogenase/malonic semialdehyde reductase
MHTALITGATSGIGKATAELFAEKKINLILCGRRNDKLIDLKSKLESKVDVKILSFDIENEIETEKALQSLGDSLEKINILINNAGCAIGFTPFDQASYLDMAKMIDVNVLGLLNISKKIIPFLIKNKSGIIINLGSIAGKEVYANGAVYCASKHAVDAITKGMRIDLNPYGIKVASINPGMVETEFSIVRFNGDAVKAKNVYKGLDPLMAEDIADAIYYMVSRPSHVVIADMTIFPLAQASASVVKRI